MPDDRLAFFELARQALGTTQEALGKRLGVSRRTAQRWGASGIPSYELTDLARLVLPRDRALAVKIAAAAGTTLDAAGIEPPPPPPAPPPDGVVDAVVCAAAEAMEMMPKEVRPGLHAAFARAKEIGLTVDVIERALRLKLQVVPAPALAEAPVPAKRKSPRE
jgi:transcriptional regulator with XRE-family HTH domain